MVKSFLLTWKQREEMDGMYEISIVLFGRQTPSPPNPPVRLLSASLENFCMEWRETVKDHDLQISLSCWRPQQAFVGFQIMFLIQDFSK